MADKKISALTGATTPLAGTEVLPIVQGGTTVNVSVANLTAGRAISATELTLTTGNLILSNGKGIDFSLTPGTGTSELLNDYEEGTFTVTLTPESGSLTTASSSGNYRKIGKLVYVHITIQITTVGTASGYLNFNGLPFAVQNNGSSGQIPIIVRETNNTGEMFGGFLGNAADDGRLQGFASASTTINMSDGDIFNIAACYAVA